MYRQTSPIGVILFFLSTLSGTALAQAESADNECTLTMGWEPWHPFQYIDAKGILTGFDIDFVEQIASTIDCKITHREVNWARGLVDLKNGDLDLFTNANFTEERSEWAHYTDAYRDSSVVIFVRKGESELYPLEKLSDLSETDFKLGISRGVNYNEDFTRLAENPKFKKRLIYTPTSEMQQYQMLQASRIDGFLRSITALKSLRQLVGDSINLEVHPLTISGAKQHVILSKESVSLTQYDKFNNGLRTIMNNGVLDSLLAKYFQ